MTTKLSELLADPEGFVSRLIERRLARGEKVYGTSRSSAPPPGKSKRWLRENWRRVTGARKSAGNIIVSAADWVAWAQTENPPARAKKTRKPWSPAIAIDAALGGRR